MVLNYQDKKIRKWEHKKMKRYEKIILNTLHLTSISFIIVSILSILILFRICIVFKMF